MTGIGLHPSSNAIDGDRLSERQIAARYEDDKEGYVELGAKDALACRYRYQRSECVPRLQAPAKCATAARPRLRWRIRRCALADDLHDRRNHDRRSVECLRQGHA